MEKEEEEKVVRPLFHFRVRVASAAVVGNRTLKRPSGGNDKNLNFSSLSLNFDVGITK